MCYALFPIVIIENLSWYPLDIPPLVVADSFFLRDKEYTTNSSEAQFFSIFSRGTYQSNAAKACGLVELRLGVLRRDLGVSAIAPLRLDSTMILRGIDPPKNLSWYPLDIPPLVVADSFFLRDKEYTTNSSEAQFFSIFSRGTYQSNAAKACGLVELRLGVLRRDLGVSAIAPLRLDSTMILRGIDPPKGIIVLDSGGREIESQLRPLANAYLSTRNCHVIAYLGRSPVPHLNIRLPLQHMYDLLVLTLMLSQLGIKQLLSFVRSFHLRWRNFDSESLGMVDNTNYEGENVGDGKVLAHPFDAFNNGIFSRSRFFGEAPPHMTSFSSQYPPPLSLIYAAASEATREAFTLQPNSSFLGLGGYE
ncbi:hypothetical protein LguiA_017702 [Lonicera macranthoides]